MEGTQSHMLPIGTLLKSGEYRVERYISSGGFGNTYEVVHTRLPKRFALKEFFMRGINVRQGLDVTVSVGDNRATFQQMKDKFYKEAQRLAQLEEQHIVEVTDFFEENQTAYYVMKLIDGESLSVTMKRMGKPFPEPEVRNILTQVLQALETVHAQSIYHLDLKPGNIMRDKKNCCWIIDFGASKQLSVTETQTMSTSTGLCYTPGYAPGEQISGNMNRIGAWTDFYALGATLYNLLTCQAPPDFDDVRYDGERAFCFPSTISDDMHQLVIWLMQPDYPQRPQKVSEITAQLTKMSQLRMPNTEAQPEVAVTMEPSILNKNTKSESTIQSPSAKTIRASQADSPQAVQISQTRTTTNHNLKRQKLWPWLLALASVVALLVVIVFVNKGEQDVGIKSPVAKEDSIDNVDQPLYPWKHVDIFSEGLARVKNDDGKYGFVDKTEQLVIPCEWDLAANFKEGLAHVKNDDDKWGFIDKTGKVVSPCMWRYAQYFSEGLAPVANDSGKWGYIDKTGQVVIPCKWGFAFCFFNGLAKVRDNDFNYFHIDKTGKVVKSIKERDTRGAQIYLESRIKSGHYLEISDEELFGEK